MDLPPDKAKLLKNYDNEKKWDIICDQVKESMKMNFIIRFCNEITILSVVFCRKWCKQKIHHRII